MPAEGVVGNVRRCARECSSLVTGKVQGEQNWEQGLEQAQALEGRAMYAM